MSTKCS